MPKVECLVTRNDSLLMESSPASNSSFLPLGADVRRGESPLEACIRAVQERTGFHVSPSCAGVVYAAEDSEHDYTLVFVADAPESALTPGKGLRWVDLPGFPHYADIPPLHRQLVPLILTSDGPVVIVLDGNGESPQVKEHALIPHARLSPLVFAVAE